jgi:hypothetical protein
MAPAAAYDEIADWYMVVRLASRLMPGPVNRRTLRRSGRGGSAMSNVQIMRELYDAFGRGDMPTVLGAMDPGIEWYEAEGNPYEPSGKPWRGVDAVVQNLFRKLATEWDGFTAHPREFHDAGSVVVVEARYTGTYRQTGKKLDAQVCHVWKMRDGKIMSFRQYTDTAQWQDVEGAR